ncbi:hypothetical protein DPSP01_003118 [Paraphaeosphaeria sporulosa]
MWDTEILKPKKSTWRHTWLPSSCPRARVPRRPLLRFLKLLHKRLTTSYTYLKYTLPVLQPICTARGCTARLSGPPSHTRKHPGGLAFTINDFLCDAHAWQLCTDVVRLNDLVFNSRRMKMREDGGEEEWDIESGRSFAEDEGGSPVVKRVSTAREGDGVEWDFCEVDEEEDHQEEEEILRMSEKGFVMFCGGKGEWWKVFYQGMMGSLHGEGGGRMGTTQPLQDQGD